MPRRTRRRNTRRRSRAVTRFLPFQDTVVGYVTQSSTSVVPRASLEIPTDRSFRVTSCHFSFIGEFQEAANSGIIQLRLYSPLNRTSSIWTSGPLLVGNMPSNRTFHFRDPMSWPVTVESNYPILAVDGLCQGSTDKFRVRFTMRIYSRISVEQVGEACPKFISPEPDFDMVGECP